MFVVKWYFSEIVFVLCLFVVDYCCNREFCCVIYGFCYKCFYLINLVVLGFKVFIKYMIIWFMGFYKINSNKYNRNSLVREGRKKGVD